MGLFFGGDISHHLPLSTCTGCGRELSSDHFREDRNKKNGRSTKCKDCTASVDKVRFERNLRHRETAIQDGHKRACRGCGEIYLIADMPPNQRATGGTDPHCHKCLGKRHKRWRDQNIEYVRENARSLARKRMSAVDPIKQRLRAKRARLKRSYGLTIEAYEEMRSAQQNKCAICETELSNRGWGPTSPQIDHNHTTGKVRAILCNRCNRGLGMFGDDAEKMTKAIIYLIMHRAES